MKRSDILGGLLFAVVLLSMVGYCAKVYVACDGVVVRNVFGVPVCLPH